MIDKPKNFQPFEFRSDYHYYEPKVYDMKAYYGGFNLRQIKRFLYILNQVQFAYKDLYKYITYTDDVVSDADREMLSMLRKIVPMVNQTMQELLDLENDDERRKNGNQSTVGTYLNYRLTNSGYYTPRKVRYPLIDVEDLENSKIKFVDKYGRPTGETADHRSDLNSHKKHFIHSIQLYFNWSYWLKYLFEAAMEGAESPDIHNLYESQKLSIKLFVLMEKSSFNFKFYRLTTKQINPHGE